MEELTQTVTAVCMVVTAICAVVMVLLRLQEHGFRLRRRRPSMWTSTGTVLLALEARLRHPFSRERRAGFEEWQGWNDPEFDDGSSEA